jgi:hypothetical protein
MTLPHLIATFDNSQGTAAQPCTEWAARSLMLLYRCLLLHLDAIAKEAC